MKKLVVFSFAAGSVVDFPEITYSNPSVDYIMFTDVDLPNTRGWNVVKIDIPVGGNVYDYNKLIKWSAHSLFKSHYEYSIYVDCVLEFLPVYNPLFFLQRHIMNDVYGINMHSYKSGGESDGTLKMINLCLDKGRGNSKNIKEYAKHYTPSLGISYTHSLCGIMIASTLKSKASEKIQNAIFREYMKWGTYRDELSMEEALASCGVVDSSNISALGTNVFHDNSFRIRESNYSRNDKYEVQSTNTLDHMLELRQIISTGVKDLIKRLTRVPKVVCSMTTHPPRVKPCVKSLENLMVHQTEKADKYILHLAKSEFPDGVPNEFSDAVKNGLIIKWVENTGPFKKFESIIEHIDDYNILVDDDLYYPLDFIESMVGSVKNVAHSVMVYYATRPASDPKLDNPVSTGNLIIPPRCWPLYPLEILDVAYQIVPGDDEAFMNPWIRFHGIKVGYVQNIYPWRFIDDSQKIGLRWTNGAVNDGVTNRELHIKKVLDHYPHLTSSYKTPVEVVVKQLPFPYSPPTVHTGKEYLKKLSVWNPGTTK